MKISWSNPAISSLIITLMMGIAGCTTTIQPVLTPAEPPQASCLPPSSLAIEAGAVADEDVRAAAQNIIDCLNTEQYRQATLQVAPELLQAAFGFSDPDDAPQVLAGLPPFVVESMANIQQQDVNAEAIAILYRREVGAHMLVHERWHFVDQNGTLILAALTPLPVTIEEDYIEVDARMLDYGYELSQTSFPANSTVVFHTVNDGQYAHEFVVFRLPEDVTMDEVGQGQLPDGLQFMGITTAPAGQTATDLVLVDLEPGAYAVVCFITEPGDIPHVGRGMVSEFTVQ